MAKNVLSQLEGLFGKGGNLSVVNVIILAVVIALGIALVRGLCTGKDGLAQGARPPVNAGPMPNPGFAADSAPAAVPASCGAAGPQVNDPESLKPAGALPVNYLRPPYLSQNPLRNANLTVREDPTIPKVDVGPFLNSTINQSDRPGLTTCGPPPTGPGPMAASGDEAFGANFAAPA